MGLRSALSDLQAGLTLGVESIPDGMASAVLAGINPMFGLHAAMVGITVGALRSSSVFMTITTTSAMTVAVGAALGSAAGADREALTILLAVVVGAMMIVVSLARLGRLVRFFSNEAMVGFLTGVAVIIILSQLGDMTGYGSSESNVLLRAFDTLAHLGQAHLPTLAVGLSSIALILLLQRTPLEKLSMVVGVAVPSVMMALLFPGAVPVVGDLGQLDQVIPSLSLPDPRLIDLDLVVSALAITIIGLVQGAGISQSMPNPDGRLPDNDRDFMAQGLANGAVGLLQGMPVGGSISATALVVAAGARTRLANISAGLIMLVLLLFFGRYVLALALPALAGLLVVVGFQAIRPERLRLTWRTSWEARATMLFTLASTLILPLHLAVFVGVGLSALLHIYRSSIQGEVVELARLRLGEWTERPPPSELRSHAVTVLDFHGNLFYASAWLLERKLPEVGSASAPVVVFRLHGHDELGNTMFGIIERYHRRLEARGGRLLLAGMSGKAMRQLERTEVIRLLGRENVFPAGRYLHQAIEEAYQFGREWTEGRKGG